MFWGEVAPAGDKNLQDLRTWSCTFPEAASFREGVTRELA